MSLSVPTETIAEILMRRDNMSKREADNEVQHARELVAAGDDPEEVLEDMFGLEPDYVNELLCSSCVYVTHVN